MKIIVKKYFPCCTILSLVLIISACTEKEEIDLKIKNIPEEINSHFVFSQINNKLYYSSNKENLFNIYELGLNHKLEKSIKLQTNLEQDVFVRSVSQDGNYLSFVSDDNGNQIYDIFIYKLKDHKAFNITKSPTIDDGNPVFSPKHNIVAFLSSGRLRLFDVEQRKFLYKSERIFKSFSWSENGDLVFLEDSDSDIWMMEVGIFSYNKIWSSPSKSYVPKMFDNKNEILSFISDHSGISSIYKLNILSKETLDSITFDSDIYSPSLKSNKIVEFRMNTKGSILDYSLNSKGELRKQIPKKNGVSYQFYSNDSLRINLFAGIDLPKHFLINGESYPEKSKEELEQEDSYSEIQPFITDEGVYHYLFLPKHKKIKGWVVWLHGGPHEQISPRYNVLMNYINKAGWGIIALNYLGSTGMGNSFEMRNIEDSKLKLDIQIDDISKNINSVKEKLKIEDEKFVILGVSYGAKLAHSFLKEYPNSVSKIIDFSGLPLFNTASDFNFSDKDFLFISGIKDFALNDLKINMIDNYQRESYVELLILKNEGHYIRRRNNIIKSLNKIIEFLEN